MWKNYFNDTKHRQRTEDVFPVVASLPPKNADAIFSAGETRAEKSVCTRRLYKTRKMEIFLDTELQEDGGALVLTSNLNEKEFEKVLKTRAFSSEKNILFWR